MIEALLSLMSRALEGIQSLPFGIHAFMALGLAAGLVLWLAGQRVLKPVVVTVVVLLCGAVGGLVVPSTSWGESLTPWHGVGLGAVVGLLIGLLLYRSAMAVGFGVVLGLLLPLIAATVLQFYPVSSTPASTPQASAASVESTDGFRILRASWDEKSATADKDAGKSIMEKVPENLKPAAERISAFWGNLTSTVAESWRGLPGTHQAIIALSAAVGLATGVITGLMLPGWAAAAVTSMFGAAVWMSCFVWISNAMNAPWKAALDRSAPQWLAAWACATVVGMVVQWRFNKRRGGGAKRAAPAAQAA